MGLRQKDKGQNDDKDGNPVKEKVQDVNLVKRYATIVELLKGDKKELKVGSNQATYRVNDGTLTLQAWVNKGDEKKGIITYSILIHRAYNISSPGEDLSLSGMSVIGCGSANKARRANAPKVRHSQEPG